MSCDTVTDIVVRESGRIGRDIYNRAFARSPWIGLVKRGEFPPEMGDTISVLTYERSAPTDVEPTWSTITTSGDAEGGVCLPTATKVGVGSTLRSYGLKRLVLEGPDFCAENLRTSFALAQQLGAIIGVLTDRSIQEWEIHDRHEYFRMVKRKVVCNAALNSTNTQAATYPVFEPTSRLTHGILCKFKMSLIRDGAGLSALGVRDGAAIFTVICSAETSESIIKDNADIRQDIRWGKPDDLLKPFGIEKDYGGFYHMIDPYPRRFTSDGAGTFTEVAPFVSAAATKGNKTDVNPAWEAAGFEESFIFDRTVFEQLIPKPITNPASKFQFDPVNYMGEWAVKNIPDRVCNPDNNILYHRGILAAGSKPVFPERGIAFIHKRCDPSLNLVTACS